MSDVEYLIVGNGLAGTLLAFEMLDKRLDFRILTTKDKSRASLVAAGMFNPLVFKRMTKSWLVDDILPIMKSRYLNLEKKLNTKFCYEKDILKPLSVQEMELWNERILNEDFSCYIKSIEIDRKYAGIKNAVGYGVVKQSGYLNLPVFLDATEQFLRKRNLIIDHSFPFESYDPYSQVVHIAQFNFDKIIFCEGHHVTRNYFFNFLPFKSVKGEVLEIYAPGLSEEYIFNKKVFVLPLGSSRFKVGSTYEWEDVTEVPTSNGKKSILDRLNELIQTDYEVINHIAGIRPTVSDRRPILGKHPNWYNLYIFNGLGTKGVMLGPYFAREMLKMVTEENYTVNRETQIERFLG